MIDADRWLSFNDEYLANALVWLRSRLVGLAAAERDAAAPHAAVRVAEPRGRSLIGRFLGSDRASAPPPSPATPSEDGREPTDAGAPVAPGGKSAAMLEAEQAPLPPALSLLARRLRLSEFERLTLFLCAAIELDTGIAPLCAHAQRDPGKPFPTFALALSLFDDPAWDALAPERPLRYFRLLEINHGPFQSLVTSALRADERIVNYLKGLNYLDDRLAPLLVPVRSTNTALPPSQLAAADRIASQLEHLPSGMELPAFQLLGTDTDSKLLIADHAAKRLGLKVHRLSADAVPGQGAEYEAFVRLWQRERALLPLALYIDAHDVERGAAQARNVRRLIARGAGVVFLDTREPYPDLDGGSVSLEVARPTPAEQQQCWSLALGDADGGNGLRLAGQFNFDATTIEQIATETRARVGSASERLDAALWQECVRRARPTLDQLAQPLEPKARWEDLELAAPEKALLRQIADQVRGRRAVYEEWGFRKRMNRGLGISVLFAGESGTGKTMAAEVIANDLGLWLHRIDLSAVVSKYIGETEKNLRRLFDAAEDGGSILFFDEADALFGRRSEVKDSHDRYANIEVNYLLQRMEAYGGLAILATNMRSALDGAFVRRLRFIVNFAFPGHAERAAIWRKAFPSETPTHGLDFARLARFNLTGGSIHNIVLNAAFLAAERAEPVTMPVVLEAARNELRKLDKPINETDFRWLGAVETGT